MANLIVAYDLRDEKEPDYDKLWAGIRGLGEAIHIQLSVWVVKTDQTPQTVCAKLKPLLRKADRLFVGTLGKFAHNNLKTKHAVAIDKLNQA